MVTNVYENYPKAALVANLFDVQRTEMTALAKAEKRIKFLEKELAIAQRRFSDIIKCLHAAKDPNSNMAHLVPAIVGADLRQGQALRDAFRNDPEEGVKLAKRQAQFGDRSSLIKEKQPLSADEQAEPKAVADAIVKAGQRRRAEIE